MLKKEQLTIGMRVIMPWNLSGVYIGSDWEADHKDDTFFGTRIGDGHIWRPRGRHDHYNKNKKLSMAGVSLSTAGNLWFDEEHFLEHWEPWTEETQRELDEFTGRA